MSLRYVLILPTRRYPVVNAPMPRPRFESRKNRRVPTAETLMRYPLRIPFDRRTRIWRPPCTTLQRTSRRPQNWRSATPSRNAIWIPGGVCRAVIWGSNIHLPARHIQRLISADSLAIPAIGKRRFAHDPCQDSNSWTLNANKMSTAIPPHRNAPAEFPFLK